VASSTDQPVMVVYVIAPAAFATGEATLSAEEYQALSSVALRSDAVVILSASGAAAVAALDPETTRTKKVLREIGGFASDRYRIKAQGPSDVSTAKAMQDLFRALAVDGSGALDVEVIALGLKALGFSGDAVGAAAALTPNGVNQVKKEDFVKALMAAMVQPQLVAVCPEGPNSINTENNWPDVRTVAVSNSMSSDEALQAKANEAARVASACQTSQRGMSHGVVLVLAERGRALLQPSEYEQHMRNELRIAAETLPPRWPLLWSPGPAEMGLLSEAAATRPVWAMPKASGPDTLAQWLRYLLVVRPPTPASH